MTVRPGGQRDARFLKDMLRHAYPSVPLGDEAPLFRYVRGWGRPGDAAVIALDEGNPVGAAWYRLFKSDDPGYGFVDEETPELAIAVVPSRRGHGLGDELMRALFDRARRDGHTRLSLSVERANPAIKLYERHGFREVGERGDSVTMLADLSET